MVIVVLYSLFLKTEVPVTQFIADMPTCNINVCYTSQLYYVF